MPANLLQPFPEHPLAHALLDGKRGLEIGAASHNPFGLNTRNVDAPDDHDHYTAESQRLFGCEAAPVDIWAYAWDIPVPDRSEDFILSSHVVEHLPDVISAFQEWNRVTKDSGLVFMVVPLKEALPEDVPRELTPLAHFIEDYELRRDIDSHPIESVPGGRMGHYHTFEPESILQIVDYMRRQNLCDWQLIAREDIDTKVGNGFTLVFQVRHSVAELPASVSVTRDGATGYRADANQVSQAPALSSRAQDQIQKLAARLSAQERFSRIELQRLESDVAEQRRTIGQYQQAIADLLSSETYSLSALLWRMRANFIPRNSRREVFLKRILRMLAPARNIYGAWIIENEPSPAELDQQRRAAADFPYRPLISILTPAHETPPEYLRAMIESVAAQSYENWELCIVDSGSRSSKSRDILTEYVTRDRRIRAAFLPENRGISGNSNAALEIARGEFIALLDHDDLLAPSALFEVAKILNSDNSVDFIYSDRDLITEDGKLRYEPFFKPGWSPEILLSANYLVHLAVIRTELARAIGGFDTSTDGAQDWDFFLRLTERTHRIVHIPKILYHWRCWQNSTARSMFSKPYARDIQKRVVKEHLEREGLASSVDVLPNGILRARWRIPPANRCSISIIVTAEPGRSIDSRLLDALNKVSSERVEILISTDESNLKRNRDISESGFRPIPSNAGGNLAQAANRAAREACGDTLLFLDGSLYPVAPDWMTELRQWFERPGIGIVGAKILNADETVAHAGVILDSEGKPSSIFGMKSTTYLGLYGVTDWYRNFLAVSTDCLMIRTPLFRSICGFNEATANYGLELCLRAQQAGFRAVYTPFAVFKYSHGKPHEIDWDEFSFPRGPNGGGFHDPYYNPNLGLHLTAHNNK